MTDPTKTAPLWLVRFAFWGSLIAGFLLGYGARGFMH